MESLTLVEQKLDGSFHCLWPTIGKNRGVANCCGWAEWSLPKPHTGIKQKHELLSTDFLISYTNFIDYNEVLIGPQMDYLFTEWLYFEDVKMDN